MSRGRRETPPPLLFCWGSPQAISGETSWRSPPLFPGNFKTGFFGRPKSLHWDFRRNGVEKRVFLRVRVQPRASRNKVMGWREGVLYLHLTAPPVEGLANKACVEFLAERLGVKRSSITLVSGEKSRDKVLQIEGLSREELEQKIGVGE
jgi:uncharacterized protein (TIGR00251 family)